MTILSRGANTIKDILQLKDEIIALLRRGNFNLKKWASNCTAILEDIDVEDHAIDLTLEAKDDHSVNVLGLHWDTDSDVFGYHTSPKEFVVTKWSILSTITRLYDPLAHSDQQSSGLKASYRSFRSKGLIGTLHPQLR